MAGLDVAGSFERLDLRSMRLATTVLLSAAWGLGMTATAGELAPDNKETAKQDQIASQNQTVDQNKTASQVETALQIDTETQIEAQEMNLTQAEEQQQNDDVNENANEEDAWRVYLDLYAFLPLQTTSTTTINENSTTMDVPLSSIFDTLTGALTFKASAEYGRLGVLTGVNHAANAASASATYVRETNNPLRNQLGLPSVLRQRNIKVKGDVDVDVDMNQTIVDLAMRYRAGAIQKPHMEQGSTSFVGFAGARLIDANLSTTVDFRRDRTVTVQGVVVNRERSRRLERSASDSWGNTWVQPLIGMMATYAISEDWQAFAYLDAGGFGLSGETDLSGTAQVGIAYALGNSAQASVSYKYFGLDYAGGSGNGYTTSQSGINLGLRWLFD
jgi:hypothetical protein